MTRTRTTLALATLALVVIVGSLTVRAGTLEPSSGDRFWTAYTELYPGTPTDERADFVATAEHICQAGAPESWWLAWDNGNRARADLWNLAITNVCPQYAGYLASVTP